VAFEPTLSELVAQLDRQVEGASVIASAQTQEAGDGNVGVDMIELTLALDNRPAPVTFRAPFGDVHSGFAVVSMQVFVNNVHRLYEIDLVTPQTMEHLPGDTTSPGGLGPGPVPA
jgi:hypothetical protein